MENKKMLGILVGIIVILGGTIGIYFLIQENKDLSGLPNSDIPNVSLTLNNGTEVEVNLSDIVDYIAAGDIELIEYSANIEGIDCILKGFNPLDLYPLYGWDYVDEVNFEAADGYNKSLSVSDFYLADSGFWKDATSDASMIAIAATKGYSIEWMNDWNEEYGDFYMFGELLSSGQKVKDIIKLNVETDFYVNVTIYNITAGTGAIASQKSFGVIGGNNISTGSGFNYTGYNWGYTDGDYSFGPDDCNGTTITSIADWAGLTMDYNVSFLAIDGWGSDWQFNKTSMENGMTGILINEDTEEMANEGKQTILCNLVDDTALGYHDGPFRIIMPGNTKRVYVRNVIEIRFFVIDM